MVLSELGPLSLFPKPPPDLLQTLHNFLLNLTHLRTNPAVPDQISQHILNEPDLRFPHIRRENRLQNLIFMLFPVFREVFDHCQNV